MVHGFQILYYAAKFLEEKKKKKKKKKNSTKIKNQNEIQKFFAKTEFFHKKQNSSIKKQTFI
jgi:hypothetical protein